MLFLITKPQDTIQVISCPQLWPNPPGWPLLLLTRKSPDGESQDGIMVDVFREHGITGYSGTVFLGNPPKLEGNLEEILIACDKEVYDTPEEIVEAGWSLWTPYTLEIQK